MSRIQDLVMIIVSYDIKNDRLRTRFSKFLLRFGCRIQLSVYRIENSPRILDNIVASIQTVFLPQFSEEDSVLILNLSSSCEVIKMGYIEHEDEPILIV